MSVALTSVVFPELVSPTTVIDLLKIRQSRRKAAASIFSVLFKIRSRTVMGTRLNFLTSSAVPSLVRGKASIEVRMLKSLHERSAFIEGMA